MAKTFREWDVDQRVLLPPNVMDLREGHVARFVKNLGACRELAPSKQESTTYEPSLVCKLLIFGCRPLIPDRLLVVEELDLGEILKSYQEERGYPPYHPVMTTAVILYGYRQGI